MIAHLVTGSGARTVVVFKRKRCRIPAFNDFAPVSRYRILALVLVGATVLCFIVLRAGQTQSSVLRRVTNTTEEGINLNPSISGDGRIIAFESTEDIAGAGGADHFRAIRANVAGDPATFFQMGGTRAVAPAVSQDGSRIAFASKDDPLGTNLDGNSEIFLLNGSSLTQITNTSPGDIASRVTNGNFQPSISDDGRFIAFSSNRNLAGQNPDSNLEIFIFDTLAASFTQLTNSSGVVGASDAKISGNGASVAYIRDTGGSPSARRDLVEQPRFGAGPTVLLAGSVLSLAMTYGRAISDDGTRVVYSAETAINTTQVFLFDGRGGSAARQITSLGARVTEVPLHPTISGDGTHIAFAARRSVAGAPANSDGGVELYVFDIPTAQMSKITNAPSSATADVVSSLNDDGSVVAFNFPRVLSGAVVNSELANDSEIYMTGTPARPPFGSITVLNGASLGKEPSTTKAVAPDSIAVAIGGALANSTQQSQKLPNGTFPTNVGGTTVTVNGRATQIFFVSPGQVNFLVPPQTEIGTAEVVITNSENFTSRGTVPTLRPAPGVFTKSGDGTGPGVILNSDTLAEGPFDPTDGKLRLTIFATGARNASQTSVGIGGRVVNAESVMASPDMPGLDEVHVLVPRDLRGAGTVDLFVQSDGRASNPVSVTFAGDSARDILINEALADPPDGIAGDANHDGVRDSGDDEFVELVNTTTHDLDISGYQLLSRSSSTTTDTLRHTFAAGTILPACSAAVVFGGGLFDPTNPVFGGAMVVKATSGGLSLTNGGGAVTLRDSAGTTITSLTWGGSTGLNGDANQSMTRSPDITGNFVLHQAASGNGGRAFSPGTRVDGGAFAVCNPFVRIEVTPTSATIDAGAKQQFTAKAFNSSGNEVSGVIFSWQSSNTAVATIDQNGLATSSTAGSTDVRASARGIQSAPATLTVRDIQRVLTRIDVTPSSATIPASGAQQFTAHGIDQFGNEITGLTFAWESTNTAVATIDQNGLASGVTQGQSTIKATSQGVTGTATLNVTAPTLVVNEVLADPPTGTEGDANHDGTRDSAQDEFVELVNSTNAVINMSGWTVRTHSTTSSTETVRQTFAANTTMPAGEGMVIFGGGTFDPNDPVFGCAQVVKASTGGLSLTNSGLTILVRDGSGNLVTQFSYGGTTGLNGGNAQSLTRSPDITGSFVLHSAAAGASGRKFSPGLKVDGTFFGSCPARLTTVTISPPSTSVIIGQSTQFTAQAFNQFGQPMTGLTINFTSDNTSVATVDSVSMNSSTGVATATVTGHAQGTAHITASATSGSTTANSNPATLTVNAPTPTLTSVTISPPSATIDAGQTQQFTGQALDQFSQPIGGVTISFASNNTPVATVDSVSATSSSGSATATVGAHTNGSAEIRATANNGTTSVTSTPATLTVAHVFNPGDVLISEFRTRGPSGASDEFIELYNPTNSTVPIGGLRVRASNGSGTISDRVTITAGTNLGSGCHYLIANTAYTGSVAANQTYGTGITDDGGVAVTQADGTTIIDQVGMSSGSSYKEGTTLAPLAASVNQSYERKPGGASGNGTDSNNNAADFFLNSSSSNPQNLSSGCLDLTAADLSITKTDSPDPVNTGSNVTYTIVVTNNGPATAQSVVVTDNLPGTVTFVSCLSSGTGVCGGSGNNRTITFSSLASGASATITLVATANSASGTIITNTATVSSSTNDPTPANNSSTATTAVTNPTSADLSISKSDSPDPIAPGRTLTYTLSVTNSGPDAAHSVVVTDNLSSDLTFVDCASNQGGVCGGTSTSPAVSFASLASGVTATITIHVTVSNSLTSGAVISNTASVASATADPAAGNNTDTEDTTIQAVNPGDILISEFRFRGSAGASDEFIELYNPTTHAIDISGYKIFRSTNAGSKFLQATINSGVTLQPGCHYLITNSTAYDDGVAADQSYSTGIADDGGIAVTLFSGTDSIGILDQVGLSAGSAYKEGTNLASLGSTNIDHSYERKPGGASGNGTDTNNNSADFFLNTAGSNPQNSSSGCLDSTSADLSITKTDSPDPVTVGSDVTYTLTVTNNGTGTAQGVVVTDNLPSSLTFVSCNSTLGGVCDGTGNSRTINFSSLAVGSAATITLVATVNGTGGASISNTASVSATTSDPNLANNSATATTTVSSADLSITKLDSPDPVNASENITYTLTVTNNSSTIPSQSVTVTDPVPANTTFVSVGATPAGWMRTDSTTVGQTGTVTYTRPTLAASGTATFTITVKVDASAANNSTISNTATVNSNTPDDTPGNNSQIATTAVRTPADLSLAEIVNNATPNVGDDVIFTVTVNNAGPYAATGVVVKDLLPAGLTYVSDDGSGSYVNGTGIWTVATVNASGSAALHITATVTPASVSGVTNTAEVTAADEFDPDSTPNNHNASEDDQASVLVTAKSADLSLTKTVDNASPNVGQDVTFTITLTNGGPNAATNVSVKDLLPAGLTFVSSTQSQGSYVSGTGIWTVGAVNASSSATLTIKANVQSSGTITNTAEVIASDVFDPDSTPNNHNASEDDQASRVISSLQADLSLVKSVDNAAPNVGDTVVFTIIVNNAGPSATTGVQVKDLLPTGLTYVSDDGGGAYMNGTGIWTVGTVGASGTATLHINATANSASINGVTNTAEITASDVPDPDSTPNNHIASEDDQSSVTVNARDADLSITKTDSPDPVLAGSDVTYTINVTNNGPDTSVNLTLSDSVPANTTFQSLAHTASWTCITPAVGGTGAISCTAPSLSASQTDAFTLVVKVNSGVAGGTTISNTASVASSTTFDPTSPNSVTETTTVKSSADLSITKTDSPDPVGVGNDIAYTITLTNGGLDAASTVTFADTVPANTTFRSLSSNAGWTCTTPAVGGTGSISCTNPSFAIGSVVFTLVARVGAAVADGTTISNTASINSPVTFDPDMGNNTATQTTTAQTPRLVISQIYPGGGLTGATFTNDFIEVFNRGSTTVDFSLTPYSVQFLSTGGSSWAKTDLTSGLLLPGRYFLVKEFSSAPIGAPLPAADVSGTINITSTTPGKVALVASATLLTGNCPGDDGSAPFNPVNGTVVDFVGYSGTVGTANHCYEGSGPASFTSGSNTTADFRKSGGCIDTNDNLADFVVSTPNPRNSTSPANDCSTGVRPDISINDPVVSEGDSGTTTLTFTVTLSVPNNAQTVTVNYATADGTATAGADYQSASGTVTFNAGVTSQPIVITINSDLLDEANETFFVNLSSPTNAAILDPQGQGTINDNDPTPSLSINDLPNIPEGNSGTSTANFTVTLSVASGQTVTVNYATGNGSATTADNDYVSTSGTLTFAPGDLTKQIPVTINGDTTVEPDETFVVDLTAPVNASITDNQGQGTIKNDDVAVTADVSIDKHTSAVVVVPGNNINYTIIATNNGPSNAANTNVTDTTPPNTTFQTITPPAGWACITPAVNGTGSISCTRSAGPLTAGASQTFPLTLKVDAGAPIGSSISNTAQITSDATDTNTANNTSTATVNVVAAGSADLSISKTDSPEPVTIGNDLTYTIALTNNGPASASTPAWSDTIPGQTNFRSMTVPAGWTCITPAVGGTGTISCSAAMLNTGSTTSFTVVVRVNTSVTDGTVISNTASASSATTDSIAANNSATASTTAKAPLLVISQIYPGGGNASATYTNDFIEVFNRGTTTIDFSARPYSVQYAPATGATWTVVASLSSGTLAPGQYFLVQAASGGANGVALPTPDATGTTDLSATAGKVALVEGTVAIGSNTTTPAAPLASGASPGCPSGVTIADFVGYGTTASCFEGTGRAPFSSTNSSARSTVRKSGGCQDTNDNSADFTNPASTTVPVAHNRGSTLAPCP